MADIFTKKKRSEIMRSIHSKWTSPEVAVHNHLKGRKVRHEMHPDMPGSPDVIIPAMRKAIFINGCFWHRCSKCFRKPDTNRVFWENKISSNVRRDRRNTATLRSGGWTTTSIWEHEIRNDLKGSIGKILEV